MNERETTWAGEMTVLDQPGLGGGSTSGGTLRTGEVAEAAGVNRQTLRYYERRGLLAEPKRSLGGHRLYPAETVTMVRVIKAAQRLGFTLDEVAELLALRTYGRRQPAGLRRRAEAKRVDIDAKITDLTLIRQALTDAIDAGCDDMSTCLTDPCCPLPFPELARDGVEPHIGEPTGDGGAVGSAPRPYSGMRSRRTTASARPSS